MIEFILHIANGKVINRSTVKKHFDQLTDGKFLVIIQNKNKRTLSQNAYLHGVLIPEFKNALVSVGYDGVKTNDQAKLIMKSMFLRDSITNEQTGEVIEYIKDTHDLTTIELGMLIDEVIKFCAENMNYVIPYPNEQLTLI